MVMERRSRGTLSLSCLTDSLEVWSLLVAAFMLSPMSMRSLYHIVVIWYWCMDDKVLAKCLAWLLLPMTESKVAGQLDIQLVGQSLDCLLFKQFALSQYSTPFMLPCSAQTHSSGRTFVSLQNCLI